MRFEDVMPGQMVHAVLPDGPQVGCIEGRVAFVNLAGRSADVEVMTDGLGITALRLTYQTPLPARSFHEPRDTCQHVYQWVDRNVA